jgi:membrane protein implicated in regulation of membrane protease activity
MTISAALIWMVIAIVALVIEATNLNLIFLFGGVAALLAGTLAALGVPPVGQILGFAVAALLILRCFDRACFETRRRRRPLPYRRIDRTDGAVTKAIDPVAGAARACQGHDWAANSTGRFSKAPSSKSSAPTASFCSSLRLRAVVATTNYS